MHSYREQQPVWRGTTCYKQERYNYHTSKLLLDSRGILGTHRPLRPGIRRLLLRGVFLRVAHLVYLLHSGAALRGAAPISAANDAQRAEPAGHLLRAGKSARVVQAEQLVLRATACVRVYHQQFRLAQQTARIVVTIFGVLFKIFAAVHVKKPRSL